MKNLDFFTYEAFFARLMPGTALCTVFFLILQYIIMAFIASFHRRKGILMILLSFLSGTGEVSTAHATAHISPRYCAAGNFLYDRYGYTASANDDAAATTINTSVDINVLLNDQPSEELDPASVSIAVQPAHGTVSVNATTGIITYTPATGYSGTDNFSYQVCDNNIADPQCDIAAVTVTITGNTGDLFIPNAFTPNNDGKNDVFKVYGSAVKGADIRIYTQWGAQIYETNDNATGWDGKSKGVAQPVGMYIYVIKVRMQDEDTFIKKGTINLIR
jgi:gliding motility-associated-like protein